MEKESKRVHTILKHVIENIVVDDEFSFINNGVSYNVGNDSKMLSKIYEIITISKLTQELENLHFNYIENNVQNKYPDFIIVSRIDPNMFYAIDIKSSYLKNRDEINGFTLGTYNGYFRDRQSVKNIVKPYSSFYKHFCVCFLYERQGHKTPIKHKFVREKWKLATRCQGSGNTCHIGSMKNLTTLLTDQSFFSNEREFNDFWLSTINHRPKDTFHVSYDSNTTMT